MRRGPTRPGSDVGSPLAAVTTFRIPRLALTDTLAVLRDAGREGHEAFVVWGGTISDDQTAVTFGTVMAPPQTAHKTRDGLLVTVDGNALFAINRAMYSRGEILAGQVHSHPTDAYHSGTDDHYPLVTLAGALSVVVPDFAAHAPDDIGSWAWYRLVAAGEWARLTRADRVEIVG
jgi:hypothetical protein